MQRSPSIESLPYKTKITTTRIKSVQVRFCDLRCARPTGAPHPPGNTSFLLRYYCENVEESTKKKRQRSRFQRVIIDDLFTFFFSFVFFKWVDICGVRGWHALQMMMMMIMIMMLVMMKRHILDELEKWGVLEGERLHFACFFMRGLLDIVIILRLI